MKIAFISTYFYPFTGGAEANCFYLAKELAKKHEVHVFTSDRKDNNIINKKEEIIDNIKIHRCKTLFRYKYYFAFYPLLLTKIFKENFDIIHTHSLGFIWHDIVLLLKKLKNPKTKFVITPHGPFMALKDYPLWQKILKFKVKLFEKLINNIYNLTIQVNPYQVEWLKKDYNLKNIVYVPNGIDKSIFKNYNKEEFIKKYNLKNKFIISYIGRFHKYKGIQDVIKVLPELIKKKPNLIFIAMGSDAGYLQELKDLTKKLKLENNILFIENISEKEKLQALESSEIFILPSEWEAFGITVLEAMAKENAIISTKTEGGKFLVSKENGLLYDFGNLKKLETSIEKLINEKLRENIQKDNLKKAKEFTWNKIAKNLYKEYNKL
ncbi:glycosyltransferase family 4 protein [Candidatus Woesearchaeota archaeon]|nr:glycosyltransferase family 4 protein [Candidatus Woesearchaeota archaeon]